MTQARAEELANAHWDYIRSILIQHGSDSSEISLVGFHYRSAFIHGYKHAIEDSLAKLEYPKKEESNDNELF